MTISEQIKESLKLAPKKSKIADKLNVSRPTLDRKLEQNDWTLAEVVLLRDLKLIK